MRHNMKLRQVPYNSIYNGNKDIEMRLNDEKRQLITTEDIITFTNIDTKERFDAKVIALHKYKDFDELYKRFDKVRLGYDEKETANPKDMEEYYTKEEIAKYGVVGIEIKKI